MSRRELAMVTKRDRMLKEIENKHGVGSEPAEYFKKAAWDNIYNVKVYYETAMNWIFWNND